MKKKKFMIISFVVVFLLSGVLIEKNKKDVKNYFERIFVENQEKKLKKEIGRKVYINEFNTIVANLDLKQLKTVNYLTDRETLQNSLNDSKSGKGMELISSPDISVKDAELILITSRELIELQEVSVELKAYLKRKYKDFDYEYFGKNGDKIISYIRDRESVYSLLPENLVNIVKNVSILQGEKIKQVLNGMKIPKEINETTDEYFNFKLNYKQMEELYFLSCALSEISEIIPEAKNFIKEMYKNFDYGLVSKEGIYFLNDKKSQEDIESEYSNGDYTFKRPYIKVNPYNRVMNSAIIKYPGVEKDTLNITVKGRGNSQNISYKIIKQNQIEIYGLFIGGEANVITISNGKDEVTIPITIEGIPSELPTIVISKNNDKFGSKDMFYTTYINKNNVYGVIFDKDGHIRYLFDPNLEENMAQRYLKFEKSGFIYFDKEDVLIFSKVGKVVERISLLEFKEGNNESLSFLDSGYPELTTKNIFEKNISIITKGFLNDVYPKGNITGIDLNNNEVIFSAEVYFDNNNKNENNINSSEEIEFPN